MIRTADIPNDLVGFSAANRARRQGMSGSMTTRLWLCVAKTAVGRVVMHDCSDLLDHWMVGTAGYVWIPVASNNSASVLLLEADCGSPFAIGRPAVVLGGVETARMLSLRGSPDHPFNICMIHPVRKPSLGAKKVVQRIEGGNEYSAVFIRCLLHRWKPTDLEQMKSPSQRVNGVE